MRHVCTLLLFGVIGSQILAADVGLYDISDASHPQILSNKLGKITISSWSNDNKRYFLAIHAAPFFSLPCSQIGLVVRKKTIRFYSQGHDGNGNFTSMETTIDDPETAAQIAKHFNVEVVKRRHPDHQMLVEFIPDKAEFSLGEAVVVKLRFTNIGNRDFAFIEGGRQRGARNNQFAFSAELVGGNMIPDTGDPRHHGGMGIPVTVKRGQSHDIQVDLTKWFDFKEAGTYNLRGSYHMRFVSPDSLDLYTIWEDYACAEFTITIKS